jgi:cell division protease FtsH
MNQNFRNFALWAVILLLLVALFNLFQNPAGQSGAPRSPTRSSAATPLMDACRAW